ncbi:MAG: acetyl-CoA carboxylase biotin carboxyl carrier protein [Candidatus Aminicenantaceae bacterium]
MKSNIDYSEIKKLIELMEDKKLSHFELEVEGFKINLSKDSKTTILPSPISVNAPFPEESKKEESSQTTSESEEADNNFYYIKSPMVGTFYRAPDPSSEPFIEIGDTVNEKQTVCIIEAMKLMNEIESEVNGTVEKILVKNGTPVEYGQPLFAVHPSQ